MMFNDAAMPDIFWGPDSRMEPTEKTEFELRRARSDDQEFVEAVYIDSMRPLLVQLDAWDENQRRAAFRSSYKASQARIILQGGTDIGWLQLNERETDFNLAQIQILPAHCGKGIGTQVILDILALARHMGKAVSLSAVRTNRAIGLYQRLGFAVIDPDATPIIDMIWVPGPIGGEPKASPK